jgi:hypothetical protein
MDDLVVLVPLHIRSLVILKSVMFIDFGAALGKGRQAAKT